ncbi:MAG: HEAT repeat domain-containing protein [Thermus sp.]|uniref:HEAT repeat domain-containing protein n=1 Tax=Thermus sp. TaxID=275 RepID=UPI00391D8C43
MWRLRDRLYAFLVFCVVLLEASALGYLTWIFLWRFFGYFPYPVAYKALILSLFITGFTLFLVALYIFLYHAYTTFTDHVSQKTREIWLERFVKALDSDEPISFPHSTVAVAALLDLREMLVGQESEKVASWLRKVRPRWIRILRSRWSSRQARLEALEALARARLPETLGVVLPYLKHPDSVLRLAAARAAARIARGEGLSDLAKVLLKAKLPRGMLLENLLLLGDRSKEVLDLLLSQGGLEEKWASLEAIARLRLFLYRKVVARFLKHPEPELRAAAMRALFALRYVPKGYEKELFEAANDELDFLRINAIRLWSLYSSRMARRVLWRALADPSFYVRRAAAEGLRRLDIGLLLKASREHPDLFAREIATQEVFLVKYRVMAEYGHLVDGGAS